ncbi:hypothetical protein [Bacillus cereus]|nr:hypothetical protein [Bacillus cereus]
MNYAVTKAEFANVFNLPNGNAKFNDINDAQPTLREEIERAVSLILVPIL